MLEALRRRLTRRRLLGGLGGGALLLAGGVLAWQGTGYSVPPAVSRRLRSLSEKEYLIVEALCDRILRSDGAMPSPASVEAPLAIDAFVVSLEPLDRRDLGRLLALVEHGLPFWAGKRDRFTRLSGGERDAVLQAMESANVLLLRGAFRAIKSLCALGYFADARVWGALDYDGPLVPS